MYKTPSENSNVNPDQNKLYAYFETDAEGIRQFNAASPEEKSGATLCRMRIRGETVPVKIHKSRNPHAPTRETSIGITEYPRPLKDPTITSIIPHSA